MGKPDFAEYVKTGGTRCPSCGSPEIHSEPAGFSDSGAVRPCQCEDCLLEWEDFYKLAEAWETEETDV